MTIRSSATNTGASSTAVVGNLPAGTQSGDLLLAFVQIRTRSVTFTPPTGWTEIYHFSSGSGPQATIAAFWYVAGGSEPSTYTWTASLAGTFQTLVVANTGLNTTSPPDVSATGFVSTTTTPAAPSVTTTVANDVLFCQYATDSTTSMTAATGQTVINTPTSQLMVSDSETIASAGATGTRAATGTSLKYAVGTVAIQPAATGGATVNDVVATQGAVVAPAATVVAGATVTPPVVGQGAVVAPAPTVSVIPGQVPAKVSTQGAVVAPAPVVTGTIPNATVNAAVALMGAIVGPPPVAAQVISKWFFTPPTQLLHYGDWKNQPLTSRIGIPTGATVLKTAGFYTINWGAPSQTDINAADVVYLGGHTYSVSQAEAAALTAAGYGANITNG